MLQKVLIYGYIIIIPAAHFKMLKTLHFDHPPTVHLSTICFMQAASLIDTSNAGGKHKELGIFVRVRQYKHNRKDRMLSKDLSLTEDGAK